MHATMERSESERDQGPTIELPKGTPRRIALRLRHPPDFELESLLDKLGPSLSVVDQLGTATDNG